MQELSGPERTVAEFDTGIKPASNYESGDVSEGNQSHADFPNQDPGSRPDSSHDDQLPATANPEQSSVPRPLAVAIVETDKNVVISSDMNHDSTQELQADASNTNMNDNPEATDAPSNNEKTDDSSAGNSGSKKMRRRPDKGEKVVITIGRHQLIQQEYTGPEVTVLSAECFHHYRNCFDAESTVQRQYRVYEQKSSGRKESNKKMVEIYPGTRIPCVGPFTVHILINATPIRDDVYFTRDAKLGAPFRLAKHCWQTLQVPVSAISPHCPPIKQSATLDVGGFKALLDTGAGPNLITLATLQRLKPNFKLAPDTTTYITATNEPMATYGRAEGIPIEIGGYVLSFTAVVVETLADEDIILGRDFITLYDVLIDIPRQGVIIRNPELKYRFVQQVEEDTRQYPYIGKALRVERIEEESIKQVKYRVRPTRKENVNRELASWLGVITRSESQSARLMEAGIGVPNEIVTVSGDRTLVSLLNAKEAPTGPERDALECEAESRECHEDPVAKLAIETSEIQINPVRISYEKRFDRKETPTGEPEQDNIHIALHYNSIQVIRVNQRPEPSSDFNSANDSELPIALPDTKPTAFPTRPEIENLRKRCTEKEFTRLEEIFDRFSDIFCKNKTDIGLARLVEHDIVLRPGAEYFRQAPRRLNTEKKQSADDTIKELLKAGLIRESKSPFASGIVMVKKKDGTYRMCVDFRMLNDITIPDAYPLPRTDDLIEALGSASLFSSLDMGWAFWQVPVPEEKRHATAFATPEGLYEFNRMPFGLCNAAATFQRLMSKVMKSVQSKYGNAVLCYIDDILIATTTVAEHLDRLEEVFTCLQEAGLKLKAAKCQIMQTEVIFLGKQIKDGKVSPTDEGIARVRDWLPPRNKLELSQFLGLVGYYRPFIKALSTISFPLSEMLSKKNPFKWGKVEHTTFEKLKSIMISKPMLELPTEDGEYILDTDASRIGLGAVLSQRNIEADGVERERVIAYGSKSLNAAQRNYSAPKLEMLAALTFIERYASYLLGRVFTLRVDNKALIWLISMNLTNNPLACRWICRLGAFKMKIEHRERSEHMNADALSKTTSLYIDQDNLSDSPRPTHLQFLVGESRKEFEEEMIKISGEIGFRDEAQLRKRQRILRQEDAKIDNDNYNQVALIRLNPGFQPKQLAYEQDRDLSLKAIKTIIIDEIFEPRALTESMSSLTKAEKQWFRRHRQDLYITREGVLMKRLEDPELHTPQNGVVTHAQMIPPQKRISEILETCHKIVGGHAGPYRTKMRILRRFDWGGLNRDVEEYVAQCLECQRNKPMRPKPIKSLKPIRTNNPNEMLEVDFLKMVKDDEGFEYIVMMIDHFTKYCVAYPVKLATSRTAAEAIWNGWISHHGFPKVIHTDQGVQFESALFKSLMAVIGAVKTHGTIYRPQTQGLVERQNQTMVNVIRTLSSGQ